MKLLENNKLKEVIYVVISNLENNICSNCNKSDVCKYKEDFDKMVSTVEKDTSSLPVDIIVRCRNWSKETINLK